MPFIPSTEGVETDVRGWGEQNRSQKQRMRPVQPSAFCGVLIKPGPHCSFQGETYVQGLAEVWD